MTKSIKRTAFLAILGAVFFISCNDDSPSGPQYNYELAPIIDVEIPDTVLANDQYNIEISYEQPSDCHEFAGFDYGEDEDDELVQYIGAVNAVQEDSTACKKYDEPKIKTKDLEFKVEDQDYYEFKFWQGVNDSLDEPEYLTKKIIVADAN